MQPKIINVHQAKTQFSKLIERVRAGEEIVIAKNGAPWVRLCPLEEPPLRQPGLLEGSIDDCFFEPLPEEELEAWEG